MSSRQKHGDRRDDRHVTRFLDLEAAVSEEEEEEEEEDEEVGKINP